MKKAFNALWSVNFSAMQNRAKAFFLVRSWRGGKSVAAVALAISAQSALAAPFYFVTNQQSNIVSVIDVSNAVVTSTITVGNNPIGIALTPDNKFAYVVNSGDNTVSVIDTSKIVITDPTTPDTSTKTIATISVGADPQQIIISADGKTAYVVNSGDRTKTGGSLSVIDTATNAVTNTIELGDFATGGLAITPDGKKVYVSLAQSPQVQVIDIASGAITKHVDVGNNPIGIAIAGNNAYVANYASDTISVIDTTQDEVIATILDGNGLDANGVANGSYIALNPNNPIGVTASPDGKTVYVSNHTSQNTGSTLSVIDAVTHTIVNKNKIGVGGLPIGITIDSNGVYAYVNNYNDGSVYAIDLGLSSLNPDQPVASALSGPAYGAITDSNSGPFALTPVNPNQYGLTGSWYSPAASGQGLSITTYPDSNGQGQGSLFAGWFTYAQLAANQTSADQRWYTLSGDISSTNPTTALNVYATTSGGNFVAPPAATSVQVGTATLKFVDCSHGVLTYTFTDGSHPSGSAALTRLTHGTTCTPAGDSQAPAPSYLLSGLWADPNLIGQGFMLEVDQGNGSLVGDWFTYAPNAQNLGIASQHWYSLQGGSAQLFANGSGSLSGISLYESIDGGFLAPFVVTTQFVTKQVGTVNIAFQSCTQMTLTYNFTAAAAGNAVAKGTTGTLNLTRLAPNAAPTICGL